MKQKSGLGYVYNDSLNASENSKKEISRIQIENDLF